MKKNIVQKIELTELKQVCYNHKHLHQQLHKLSHEVFLSPTIHIWIYHIPHVRGFVQLVVQALVPISFLEFKYSMIGYVSP